MNYQYDLITFRFLVDTFEEVGEYDGYGVTDVPPPQPMWDAVYDPDTQTWSESAEGLAMQLQSAKDRKLQEITAAFSATIANPPHLLHIGVEYQADERAMGNVIGTLDAIAKGWALPVDFAWRAADNSMHPMTAQDVQALHDDMVMHRADVAYTAYAGKWARQSALANASTVAEVEAV